MLDGVTWALTNLVMGFINIFKALSQPQLWLDWSNKEALGRFIYYGGSVEFFFAVLSFFVAILIIGLVRRRFLWGFVWAAEGVANVIGRFFAWAALLMVLQQVMIIFLQRIFRVSEIEFGPFGFTFVRDLSWWSEELKLYNAMIVALCCAYTFAQGGHVRVDLIYSAIGHRAKRVLDMFGALFFILPAMTLTWLFGWYFMWRHLVTPKINATESVDLVLRKANIMKWNVETIGFSPNGFDGYFLFKILLVAFAGMMFLHAWTFFYRSLLEFIEGKDSADKYLDKDKLGDETADMVAEIH